MTSPKAIAALVSQMKPPLEMLNQDSRIMWMLEQAAEIGMRAAIYEMVKPVSKTIGEHWR